MEKPIKSLKVNWMVLLLLGVSFFSVFTLKEKNDLSVSLEKLKTEATALDIQRQNLTRSLQQEKQLKEQLSQQNTVLNGDLMASTDQLDQRKEQLAQIQDKIAALEPYLSLLKAENTALQEEVNNLKGQLAQMQQENQEYSAKLNSLEGLKIAIKELKMRMRQVKRGVREKTSTANKIEGNEGFTTLNGESTQSAKNIKIEVKPASSSE